MGREDRRCEVVRLYGVGVPVPEIAEMVGLVSAVRVYEILGEAGHAAGVRYGPRPRVDDAVVIAAFGAHGTIKQAAAAVGISQEKARKILVAAGLVSAAPRRYRRARRLVRAPWGRNQAGVPAVDSAVSQQISAIKATMSKQVSSCTLPAGSRFLTLSDRLRISDLRGRGWSMADIATAIGKNKSTVSRELSNNCVDGEYLPHVADELAARKRRRPRLGKLHSQVNQRLHDFVTAMLADRFSPQQIAGRLLREFPDDESMHISHEAIYQSLFIQGRGNLKVEVKQALRTGRAHRQIPGQRHKQDRFTNPMVMIADRPAEVADRAIPGHWEGDLICGTGNRSAIGTLVERSTRFVMLLHLPDGHTADRVRDAIIAALGHLPEHLARSLTWDQGSEMARHAEISETVQVYFCDPASPWQRGSNENTNGLLRQFFPKGTDLNVHDVNELARVADLLNRRPRATLDFATPAEMFNELLSKSAS